MNYGAHIFLGEIYQVLKINVISVGPNVVVNEEVELVLDPVLEDKGQDSCSQLQEEDDTQEHRELKDKKKTTFTEFNKRRREAEGGLKQT